MSEADGYMDTTINQAREAVYRQFRDNWIASVLVTIEAWGLTIPGLTDDPMVPYAFGDEKIDPPNGPWVRVSVQHLTSSRTSIGGCGNRRFQRPAIAFFQFFMPPDQEGGSEVMDLLVESARRVFEGRRIDPEGLNFDAVTPRENGVIEKGRWTNTTLEAPFWYDVIK
jgi:hypothetical protein